VKDFKFSIHGEQYSDYKKEQRDMSPLSIDEIWKGLAP
jgi:hypothetical protein